MAVTIGGVSSQPASSKPGLVSEFKLINPIDLRKFKKEDYKTQQSLTIIRNRAIDILSDYISENIKGYGKPVDSRFKGRFGSGAAKGKDSAPDSQLSVKEFNSLIATTGTQISQTRLLQESSDVAFTETKITLDSGKIEGSSAAVDKGELGASDLYEKLEKRLIAQTGQAASDLLWSPAFAKTRANLLANIGDKLENITYVEIGDADKKRDTKFKFFGNLDKLADASLNQQAWDSVYETRVRIKREKGRFKGIFFSAAIKSSYKKELDKKATDISEQIKTLTQGKFEDLFLKYAIDRVQSKGVGSYTKDDINVLLGFIAGFAEEFKRGGFTPYSHKFTVQSRTPKNISGAANFPDRKPASSQKFISQVQLTALVQDRLRKTMQSAGAASPPDLKNRTGRFIASVRAIPNYRKSIITYFLNPIYTSLEQYGYRPGQQIEQATREVAVGIYKQRFNIVRGT